MSSKQTMILSVPVSAQTFMDKVRISASSSRQSFNRIASYMEAIAGGPYAGSMSIAQGAVQAAGSVTFTGRPTADQTMVVCNTTLTAKDSGADGTTQFNTSGSDVGVTATNLAACINANTTLNKIVSASSALGVVTITAIVPGVVGNAFQLSEGMDNTTASAFANGSNGTLVTISNGY